MDGKIIQWLSSKLSADDRERIGPKAASLCMLRRLGMRIPPCFFVATTAFSSHLDANDLRPRIASLSGSGPNGIEEIRRLIVVAPLADSLREQISTAYHNLRANTVAVRSSASTATAAL